MPDGSFPPGFFDRADPSPDRVFYAPERLVTHIDDGAIAAVAALYAELDVSGRVLDLMSSWVSHLPSPPAHLTVLGMNERELVANPMADEVVVHDLNEDPTLPFEDGAFDDVVCCVSVDYLVRPVEVFAEVARVTVPGGRFTCTFSNRLFPTKAIRGWLAAGEGDRPRIVEAYLRLAGGWDEPVSELRTPLDRRGDPLWAVHATRVA